MLLNNAGQCCATKVDAPPTSAARQTDVVGCGCIMANDCHSGIAMRNTVAFSQRATSTHLCTNAVCGSLQVRSLVLFAEVPQAEVLLQHFA